MELAVWSEATEWLWGQSWIARATWQADTVASSAVGGDGCVYKNTWHWRDFWRDMRGYANFW